MPEYIERDVVINDIGELFTICYETLPNEYGHHFIVEKELQTHLDFVRNLPAADVVEVVRCKDCDLWNEWDETGHKKLGNYACSCAYFSNEDGYVVYTGPDDYCSYGERKEG